MARFVSSGFQETLRNVYVASNEPNEREKPYGIITSPPSLRFCVSGDSFTIDELVAFVGNCHCKTRFDASIAACLTHD
jgi:hypothetical protein